MTVSILLAKCHAIIYITYGHIIYYRLEVAMFLSYSAVSGKPRVVPSDYAGKSGNWIRSAISLPTASRHYSR